MSESNNIVRLWLEAKAALQAATEAERKLRASVIASYFGAEPLAEGTRYSADGTLKATFKVNRRLHDVEDMLSALEEAGYWVEADQVVNWAPSLALGEYRRLDAAALAIVDRHVTASDGTATLEIVAPKS